MSNIGYVLIAVLGSFLLCTDEAGVQDPPQSSDTERLNQQKLELEVQRAQLEIEDLKRERGFWRRWIAPNLGGIATAITLIVSLIIALNSGVFEGRSRLLEAKNTELANKNTELEAKRSRLDSDNAKLAEEQTEVREKVRRVYSSMYEAALLYLTQDPPLTIGASDAVSGVIFMLTTDPQRSERLKGLEAIVSAKQPVALYPIALFVLYHATQDVRWHDLLMTFLTDEFRKIGAGTSPGNAGHGADPYLGRVFRVLDAKEWSFADRQELVREWIASVPSSDSPGWVVDHLGAGDWLFGRSFRPEDLRNLDPYLFMDLVTALMRQIAPVSAYGEHVAAAASRMLAKLSPPAYMAVVSSILGSEEQIGQVEDQFLYSMFVQNGEFLTVVPPGSANLFLSDWPLDPPRWVPEPTTGEKGAFARWRSWRSENVEVLRLWEEPGFPSMRAEPSRLHESFRPKRR